jgi:tRNA pseudouridine55 synthase
VSRRRKGRDIHGVILLDKPAGYSSNQAVQAVRRLLQARKAGHTGSLDPFATGMLPVCLGEASKTAGYMLDAAKTYLATAEIGRATDTGDIEGDVVRTGPVPELDTTRIEAVLEKFRGEILQVPPMYSALKRDGQPLYKLARAGQEVSRDPRPVTIHELELDAWEPPFLSFRVRCSKGTYIRTLAEDIAREFGSCAHLRALRRLEVEPFRERDMVNLETLSERLEQVGPAEFGSLGEALLPIDAGLGNWPVVRLDQSGSERFRHGNPVEAPEGPPGPVRVYGPPDRLLGLGERLPGGRLVPRRVMNLQASA